MDCDSKTHVMYEDPDLIVDMDRGSQFMSDPLRAHLATCHATPRLDNASTRQAAAHRRVVWLGQTAEIGWSRPNIPVLKLSDLDIRPGWKSHGLD